ncbi:MAG: hypothetical protein MJ094_03625, partial [Saccharofermentans sp.]|nr:hypothetical protein [Saccharofermentans sp.]
EEAFWEFFTKGVNVSEQRVAELKEQFPDQPQNDEDKSQAAVDAQNPFPDVRLWPELAYAWMNKL